MHWILWIGLLVPSAMPRDWYLDQFKKTENALRAHDAVKIRRIAQNLILNAVKYTRSGGVTVTWGESEVSDYKRWCLSIADTGPGFHSVSGQPIAAALDPAHEPSPAKQLAPSAQKDESVEKLYRARSTRGEAGEGIGLSIVKRLCEMLDATIEMESVKDQGSTFRILFPRHYSS